MSQRKIKFKLIPPELYSEEQYYHLYGKSKGPIDYMQHPSAAPPGYFENIKVQEVEVEVPKPKRGKLKKIDRFFQTANIQFDVDGPVLTINKTLVQIPRDTDQFHLCKTMFSKKKRTPLPVNKIYYGITGLKREGKLSKREWNKVNDAVRKINGKVRKVLDTNQDLLKCTAKEVIIDKYFNWV